MATQLVRLKSDELINQVREQWLAQINDDEGLPIEQLDVYFNQAKRVVADNAPPDDRGMFVLEVDVDDCASYEAICFINHAWAKSELRIVTLNLAPKYDAIEHRTIRLASVFSGLITQFVSLARSQWKAPHVKIYIQDSEFRALASGIASSFVHAQNGVEVDVIGNWLHITGVDCIV
ncbi:hypothetical protein MACH10_09970 [Thalassospira tepidiphila]|uniref:hypothetical protein n=1 Tax=Thalassospira tepidiphila TaxID=393657 RepID=UPI002922D092|nr:hypothetical protein MACH10_09970 [Thalassospira tepidiphila]